MLTREDSEYAISNYNADSDTQLSNLIQVLAIPNVSFDSSQTVTELVQKTVQNQAKVTQLAPATNEKSSCLRQLHHQSAVARFTVAARWTTATTNCLGAKRDRGRSFVSAKTPTLGFTGLAMAQRV